MISKFLDLSEENFAKFIVRAEATHIQSQLVVEAQNRAAVGGTDPGCQPALEVQNMGS